MCTVSLVYQKKIICGFTSLSNLFQNSASVCLHSQYREHHLVHLTLEVYSFWKLRDEMGVLFAFVTMCICLPCHQVLAYTEALETEMAICVTCEREISKY